MGLFCEPLRNGIIRKSGCKVGFHILYGKKIRIKKVKTCSRNIISTFFHRSLYIKPLFYVHLPHKSSNINTMDFKTLCQARYSVRAYKQEAVPADTLEYIKECTRLAPSAVNRQPWHSSPARRRKAAACCTSATTANGSRKLPYTFWYAKTGRRPGPAATTRRTMPTSTRPSPSNTFVWLLPNKGWAHAGYAISAYSFAANCSTCPNTFIPWPSSHSVIRQQTRCRRRHGKQ